MINESNPICKECLMDQETCDLIMDEGLYLPCDEYSVKVYAEWMYKNGKDVDKKFCEEHKFSYEDACQYYDFAKLKDELKPRK